MISSSSNNRTRGQRDAVLTIDSSNHATPNARSEGGSLRLPQKDVGVFVDRFNRTYARIGLSVRVTSTPSSCQPTTAEALRQKVCGPCEGGVPMIESEAATVFLQSLVDWSIDDSGKRIFRIVNAGNFVKAMEIMQRIAVLAEAEQHHPDLHLTGYQNLRVELTTHAIGGLSENDFVFAAKVDTLID